MKQALFGGILLIVIAVILGGFLLSRKQPQPTPEPSITPTVTVESTPVVSPTEENECSALSVTKPESGGKVSSPLAVEVVVDNRDPECRWTVFEAQAGLAEVVDSKGVVLGSSPLTTEEDWMTEQPVIYTATISFTNPATPGLIQLKIHEENPSGEPGAQTVTVPLTF